MPLTSVDIREKLRNEIFNPLAKIGHHVRSTIIDIQFYSLLTRLFQYLIEDENTQPKASRETRNNNAGRSGRHEYQKTNSASPSRVRSLETSSKLPQTQSQSYEGDAGDIEMLEVRSSQEGASQGQLAATAAASAASKKRMSSDTTVRPVSPVIPSSPRQIYNSKRPKLSNCRSPIDIRFAESDGLQDNHDDSDDDDDDLSPRC